MDAQGGYNNNYRAPKTDAENKPRGTRQAGAAGTQNKQMSSVAKEILDKVNLEDFEAAPENARFFVIKSYSEDDVHKSLKYNAWASTETGNRRLDQVGTHNTLAALLATLFVTGYFVLCMWMHVDVKATISFPLAGCWLSMSACVPMDVHGRHSRRARTRVVPFTFSFRSMQAVSSVAWPRWSPRSISR